MTYIRVQPQPRWRRRRLRRLVRRLPRTVLWLAGTAGVTWWWATRPEVGWADVPPVAAAYGLLLGAGLVQPWRGRVG